MSKEEYDLRVEQQGLKRSFLSQATKPVLAQLQQTMYMFKTNERLLYFSAALVKAKYCHKYLLENTSRTFALLNMLRKHIDFIGPKDNLWA